MIWTINTHTLFMSISPFRVSGKKVPFSCSFSKIFPKTRHSASRSALFSPSNENFLFMMVIVVEKLYKGSKRSGFMNKSCQEGRRLSMDAHNSVFSEENRRLNSSSILRIRGKISSLGGNAPPPPPPRSFVLVLLHLYTTTQDLQKHRRERGLRPRRRRRCLRPLGPRGGGPPPRGPLGEGRGKQMSRVHTYI